VILITTHRGASHITPPQALGDAGLAVATILGLRVLVAITPDRVV
jgi:hypothetical protein